MLLGGSEIGIGIGIGRRKDREGPLFLHDIPMQVG